MKTTKQSYADDWLSHTTAEMKKFYTVKGSKVFLTAYALACGYKDITYVEGLGFHYIVMENGIYKTGTMNTGSQPRYVRTLSLARKGL